MRPCRRPALIVMPSEIRKAQMLLKRARVEADPADQQARFDYATALHAGGDVEQAIEQLLEAFRRDRDWNDGAAKAQLLTIFDALKPTDPLAQKGRRRLSSLIFS